MLFDVTVRFYTKLEGHGHENGNIQHLQPCP